MKKIDFEAEQAEKEAKKLELEREARQRDEQDFLRFRREILELPPDRRSYHGVNEARFRFFWNCFTRSLEVPDEIWQEYRVISEKFFTENPNRAHVAVINFRPLFEKNPLYFIKLGQFQDGGARFLEISEGVDKKYAKMRL